MEDLMRKVNRLMVEVFNDILTIEETTLKNGHFHDVSVTEVHTVEAIGLHAKRSMGEVAKSLKITVGTLTVAISNLVGKGYVARSRDGVDRRVVQVQLTNKGRLLYRIHQKFHNDMIRASLASLSEQEGEALTKALDNIRMFLTKTYAMS